MNEDGLKEFYKELYEIHKDYPDWKFGEIIVDFMGWLIADKYIDIAFPENDEMLKLFREYMKAR